MTAEGEWAKPLPCPFCGSPAKKRDGKVTCGKSWSAVDQCAMFPHWVTIWAWNRRTPDPATQRVVDAAVAWNPTVRGASRDHLIPEARELVEAVEALAGREKNHGNP